MRELGGIAAACVWFAFYVLLAGQVSFDEVAIGAVLGISASGFALVLSRLASRDFVFGWPEARRLLIALVQAPGATARIGMGFAGELIGRGDHDVVRLVRFQHGPLRDAHQNARRAAYILARSLAPDSFIFRMDPNEADVREHGLQRSKPEELR